jgi:predicted  nucleic acid-binding Zn-ribbon protein
MHSDLVKLLELQAKDDVLSEVDQRLATVDQSRAALDQRLQSARQGVESARQALLEGRRRRDELESKIESYRVLQDRRRQRLEQVRNPKEASAVTAELDMARSVMAKEESEWVRSADAVIQLEHKLQSEESNLNTLESGQAGERSSLEEQ